MFVVMILLLLLEDEWKLRVESSVQVDSCLTWWPLVQTTLKIRWRDVRWPRNDDQILDNIRVGKKRDKVGFKWRRAANALHQTATVDPIHSFCW